MEHDLFVAVVAVDRFCASLPVSHVQPSAETASEHTESMSNKILSTIAAGARTINPAASLIECKLQLASCYGTYGRVYIRRLQTKPLTL